MNSCADLIAAAPIIRYEPAKIQLEGWVYAFAKWHEISVQEASDIIAKYAKQMHSLPTGTTSNAVRNLPLKPFDDTNPAWIHTVMKNVPKAGPRSQVALATRQVGPSLIIYLEKTAPYAAWPSLSHATVIAAIHG